MLVLHRQDELMGTSAFARAASSASSRAAPTASDARAGLLAEAPFGRNAVQMHVEQLALPVSDGEIAHRRVRHTLSVVLHRSGQNIKCGIVGSLII